MLRCFLMNGSYIQIADDVDMTTRVPPFKDHDHDIYNLELVPFCAQ